MAKLLTGWWKLTETITDIGGFHVLDSLYLKDKYTRDIMRTSLSTDEAESNLEMMLGKGTVWLHEHGGGLGGGNHNAGGYVEGFRLMGMEVPWYFNLKSSTEWNGNKLRNIELLSIKQKELEEKNQRQIQNRTLIMFLSLFFLES